MADLYEILGVAPEAGAAEIRRAYLRLAKERHPDRYTDPTEKAAAAEAFKQISEAFNTLCNERARAEYDTLRSRPQPRGAQEMAQDAYARGVQALEARRYADAAELLKVAVAYDGSQARHHLALGRALAHDPGRVREAAEAFEQAAQLEPRLADAYLEHARLLFDKGLNVRARRVAESGLLAVPGHAGLRALLQGSAAEAPASGGGLLERFRRKS